MNDGVKVTRLRDFEDIRNAFCVVSILVRIEVVGKKAFYVG